MTILNLTAAPLPLTADENGVLRVGGTRVRLEMLLTAFNNGCAAEEILLKYPSLDLTDIYACITYYLWHRTEMDEYLAASAHHSEEARKDTKARFPSDGIRERLLARKSGNPS